MYLSTPLGPLRLPVDERIDVWMGDGGVMACHQVRVLGLRAFTLDYAIERLAATLPMFRGEPGPGHGSARRVAAGC